MFKKSLIIAALTLTSTSSFAAAYSINEQPLDPLVGNSNSYHASNILVNNQQFGGVKFDVTTAGNLDIFADDHNDLDAEAGSVLYVFKLDSDGQDWTLTAYNEDGPRVNVGTNAPKNFYDIDISGRDPLVTLIDTGSSDPGLTQNFSLGTYLALYVSGFSIIDGYNGVLGDALAAGAKLSTGFADTDLFPTSLQPIDLFVRATAGSTAVLRPAVQTVPVPGAVWLMGSILAGFGAFGRKKAIAA